MTNAATTKAFFIATNRATVNMVLDNIAAHYGISRADAFTEVTDVDAESLLDYVTGHARAATSVIMQKHGLH